jgi:antitoxin MazE
MTEATLDIKAWGNSLGLRLPAAVARAVGLTVHQRVRLSVEAGRVIITPQGEGPITLAQRLALFDPAVHGGEAMAAPPVGREVW